MKQITGIILLSFIFLQKMIASGIRMGYLILFRINKYQSGLVTVPVKVKKTFPRLILFNMITMTPGTMSLRLDDPDNQMLVHTIDKGDRDSLLGDIQLYEKYLSIIFNER